MALTNAEMIAALFGIRTAFAVNPQTNTVGVTEVMVLPNDPMRVGIVFVNNSANAIYVLPRKGVSADEGIYLAPNGGTISMVWDRDFELCSVAWYALAGGAGSRITILVNKAM